MSNNKKPIPQRIYNASKDHPYVAGAVDIVNDRLNKNQQQVNAENDAKFSQMDDEIEAWEAAGKTVVVVN